MTPLKLTMRGEIGGQIKAAEIRKQIDDYVATGGDSIDAILDSAGGDVLEAYAIYNAIKDFKGQKNVVLENMCASAAALVMLAFDSIKAKMATYIMIHAPLATSGGNAEDMKRTIQALETIKGTIATLTAARMAKPIVEATALLDKETSYNAIEAFNAGLIDGVVDMPPIKAMFNAVKKIFGLADYGKTVKSEAQILAASQGSNNTQTKVNKMAEYKDVNAVVVALEAFLATLPDGEQKTALKDILDGAVKLKESGESVPTGVKPTEDNPPPPPDNPEAKIKTAIEAALNPIKTEFTARLEAADNRIVALQDKLLGQGHGGGSAESKPILEEYSAIKDEGKKQEFYMKNKSAILSAYSKKQAVK